MEYNDPIPGDTIHCWADGKNYLAHRQMLYLGKDENTHDNVLVQSVKYGWNIISLSELPTGKYRSVGVCNLIEIMRDQDQKVNGYVYQFRDHGNSVLITVKLINGIWKIKKDFKPPTWMQKEAKGVKLARR